MRAKRRIFIGDVQGCREPLERLLSKLGFEPSGDRLFMTGDLVNRGPDSLGVLRLLKRLGARSVLGNHDAHLLDLARGRAPDYRPQPQELKDVQFIRTQEDGAELIAWVESFPALLHLKDVVLVHAAIRPGWGPLKQAARLLNRRLFEGHAAGRSALDDEDLHFALTARFCDPSGRQAPQDWPPPGPPYVNWVELLEVRETVVFGHFARQGLLQRPGIRGLDSGCVHGGALTAWIAEEDRLESVPCRRKK